MAHGLDRRWTTLEVILKVTQSVEAEGGDISDLQAHLDPFGVVISTAEGDDLLRWQRIIRHYGEGSHDLDDFEVDESTLSIYAHRHEVIERAWDTAQSDLMESAKVIGERSENLPLAGMI